MNNLNKEIINLANDILEIHKNIETNINKILNEKENINSKLSCQIDDFTFYNSLIDNCVFYYSKSRDIRFKKLTKDFDEIVVHFNKISYDSKIINSYNFDKNIVKKILDAYDKCKQMQENNTRWMKDKHELQDWAKELKKLLVYHKYLVKSLYDSLICQVNYFTIKKKDDEFKGIETNIKMNFCNCVFDKLQNNNTDNQNN